MDFAAATGTGGKQTSKKLDVSRYNQRSIPVFGSQTVFSSFFVFTYFQIAMVFQHNIRAENVAENRGILLNDAGKRNGVNNAFLVKFKCVL